MIQRSGTWGEVAEGSVILSPKDLPLLVVKTAATKKGLWYLAVDHGKREFRIPPKPSDLPVNILEATPEEAELLVTTQLGGVRLLDRERELRMAERAKQWIVPPLASKGRGALEHARTHVEWYHGTYGGSADYAGGFKTLKQIREAHDQMHAEVFMDLPHTHKED